MRLSLIVAVSENHVIGSQGDLPWRLSSDLRRFKQLTMGHHLIMGRKTLDSIGRALPGRTSIVLTRQADYAHPDILVAHDLDEALELARLDDEAFVIGGGEIYRLSLPRADRIYLTRVQAQVEGDTFFPQLDGDQWKQIEQQRFDADERNDFPHSFEVLDRRPAP